MQFKFGLQVNKSEPQSQYKMKFIALAFLLTIMVVGLVSAVPVDETIVGDVYGADNYYNPQDPNAFFKLKKLKKLLFG